MVPEIPGTELYLGPLHHGPAPVFLVGPSVRIGGGVRCVPCRRASGART